MTVYSWGRGEDGQLGLGDTSDQHRPVPIDALAERRIVQIACGSGHTVVLTGAFFARRRSIHMGPRRRRAPGPRRQRLEIRARLVEELRGKNIRQVTCGSYHTAAVTVSGPVHVGRWHVRKTGPRQRDGSLDPFLVETLKSMQVRQVACGSRHTVVLLENKDVYTWGDKENGVSGHGDTEGHQYLPCPVEELRGKSIVQISACGFHTAALSEFGEVFTFGEGKFGRLGHNSERNQPVARFVEALAGKRVKQVACGGFHTAAVTETGEVTLPKLVDVLEGKRVISVASYNEHTVALVDPVAMLRASMLTSSYVGDMRQLIDSAEFSDVTFLIEGRAVHSHRAILAARIFLALLEYIYVDSINVGAEMALELYAAADLYTLDRLKGLCEIIVQKNINVDNAAALFQSADDLHSYRLREICLSYMVQNFDMVTKSDGFAGLSRDLILEVLQNR
ncbi:SKP1/BTB/POZ domain [Phytophthora cactorum]|nr:SKP1/BTB/POZ domain [Phytophthora cactorum]